MHILISRQGSKPNLNHSATLSLFHIITTDPFGYICNSCCLFLLKEAHVFCQSTTAPFSPPPTHIPEVQSRELLLEPCQTDWWPCLEPRYLPLAPSHLRALQGLSYHHCWHLKRQYTGKGTGEETVAGYLWWIEEVCLWRLLCLVWSPASRQIPVWGRADVLLRFG